MMKRAGRMHGMIALAALSLITLAEELRVVQSQRGRPGMALRQPAAQRPGALRHAGKPVRVVPGPAGGVQARARWRDRRPAQQAGAARPDDLYILRGGGFVDVPGDLRSAQRIWNYPHNRLGSYGFRIARTLP